MTTLNEYNIYNPSLKWYNMPNDTEYIKILQDQGVSNFDPVKFYKEANKDDILQEQNSKLTKKQRKKLKKSKTALKIIADNIKRKEMILRKDEERKIEFYLKSLKKLSEVGQYLNQMSTNYGRIKLKIKFLDYCLSNEHVLGAHLLFFSLNSEKNLENNELKNLFKQVILKYKSKYKNENLTKIQMTQMSSYLPPLDPFKRKVMKLDDWQINVFKLIEQNQNILIVAPTSAGKTVCSTYCAVSGHKTLFVVPSDELARQVAGIFRNMDLNIGLITNKEFFLEENYSVLIGTPYKLEEYIILNKDNNFDSFKYVIYDEIQMLNAEEGNSFEKIIKLMKCPLLALSATIEEPLVLQSWLEKIKNQKIHLVTYHKRFIVQQRYLWQDELVHLHPLSCTNIEYLSNKAFLKSEMSFTPRDSYDLYEKMKENGLDVKSANQFFKKNRWDQITLNDSIKYEIYLKEFLAENVKEKKNIDAITNILDSYKVVEEKKDINIVELIKTLYNKKMFPIIIFKMNSDICEETFVKLVNQLDEDQKEKYPYHYSDLETQFDSYSELTNAIEKMKNISIPKDTDADAYLDDERKKIENDHLNNFKEKMTKILNKRINRLSDFNYSDEQTLFYKNYYNDKIDSYLKLELLTSVDKNRPHPEFMFNHMGVTSTMMRQFRRKLKLGLGHNISWSHPFLRGIERGIAPYFKNMSSPFQLLVQSLYS